MGEGIYSSMANFKSNVSKFRVPIAATPVWKIEAISKYKSRSKRTNKAQSTQGIATNIIDEIGKVATVDNSYTHLDKSRANYNENINNSVQKGEILLESSQKRVIINNVNVIDFAKFKELNEVRESPGNETMDFEEVSSQLNITVEQIETELQNLVKNSELVKKEVSCLNNVRCALLWLLKKTTNYDTYRNHSLI